METIKLRTRIGSDGLLKLEMPVGADVDADVMIVYSLQLQTDQAEWEAFVNVTYGILADDPIELS